MGLSSSKPTEATRSEVQSLIDSNKVLVFAKVTCPYCTSTKALFKMKGVDYHSVNVDTASGGSKIYAAVKELTGQHTVPNIFIQGKSIGGNSELQALNKSGQLDEMLKGVGVLK